MTKTIRWGICLLADEAPVLVATWLAHHLKLGADRIYLFLDRPSPELGAEITSHPKIEVTVCDDRFWQQTMGLDRPRAQSHRQRALLTRVLASSDLDWLFHIDLDEFLAPATPLEHMLRHLGPDVLHARFRVQERVHLSPPDPRNIFDGAFRRLTPSALEGQVRQIDQIAADFLNRGMTGYAGAKTAYRARCALPVGVHGPPKEHAKTGALLEDLGLLHFEGLTPRHWACKRQRTLRQQPGRIRTDFPFRVRQLEMIDALNGNPE